MKVLILDHVLGPTIIKVTQADVGIRDTIEATDIKMIIEPGADMRGLQALTEVETEVRAAIIESKETLESIMISMIEVRGSVNTTTAENHRETQAVQANKSITKRREVQKMAKIEERMLAISNTKKEI
jgi:hypothetical protein